MLRNLSELAARDYDLVIVGGGIFGVCAAWDASLRGLSVALLEAHDFGHAASANCFKMVHGGIRYLQHADLIRLRQSTAERASPGTAWRYCQKFSPCPARRRPWNPMATVAASISAWASKGGRAPATFSASRRSPTGPWGLSRPRGRRGSITPPPPAP